MSSSSTQSSLGFYDYEYELNGKIYSFSISAPDIINSLLAAESAAITTYFPELLATGEGIPVATALLVMGVAAGTLLDVLTGINAPNATPSNVVGATVLDGILTAAGARVGQAATNFTFMGPAAKIIAITAGGLLGSKMSEFLNQYFVIAHPGVVATRQSAAECLGASA